MKIERISTTLVFANWRNWVFVQVYTDAGMIGLGEATLRSREHAVAGAVEDMARVLVGEDPFEIHSHWQTLYRDFHNRGGVVLMTAIASLEIALWDILGQAAGLPVYQLLGGRLRSAVRAYGNGWFEVARTPHELPQLARQAADQGFTALKWNPFAGAADGWMLPRDARRAVREVAEVRQAVGEDVDLLLEAHGLFTPAAALRMAEQLAEFRPLWLEEPIPPEDTAAMAEIRQRSPIAIAAGERLYSKYEFAPLLERRGVDIIQPDPLHCGGILETRAIAAMAETHYISFSPHNSSSPLGTAVCLQLDACIPNFLIQELPLCDVPWREEIITPPIETLQDGQLAIPDRPGLGVRLNEEVARRHPYQDPDRSALSAASTPDQERLARRLRRSQKGEHTP